MREGEGNEEGGINAILYSPSTYGAVPANQIVMLLFYDDYSSAFGLLLSKKSKHNMVSSQGATTLD